jgi:Bifunctional DNA primase/polymerase, N-terminal/Primase C terminal 1 (PriCT-1)
MIAKQPKASSGRNRGQAALKIAGKGNPVFPCKPDKSPYTPRGFKDATTNPGLVAAFWKRHPNAKIGMPTGSWSDCFVVDEDRPKAVEELERELPETLIIRTPSGGRHFYFKHVDGLTNSPGALPEGIDIRGEGGYVIVPPSEGYTIEVRAPIADAPDWLLEALRDEPRRSSKSGQPRSPNGIPDEGAPIHEGARDETLARIAGRLHDGTRHLRQLEDDLQAINEARCIPPLPPKQVRKIAQSIYRYEPCRPAGRAPDQEAVSALAKIERALLGRECKGKGGKTQYSIAVAALKIARRHGTLTEDGVRLEVSARQLALAAAVSRSSIMRNIPEMGDVLRVDNENVEPGKSGALVLLSPPAPTDTTLPTESFLERDEGGCVSWRAPLTAPRLRWSTPSYKPRRGLVKGTTKVRSIPLQEKRAAVIRLGKSCERVMDSLEAAGGTMTLSALADAVDVKRPRDLTRRKNPKTGKGRDGFVTRLQDVGVLALVGDTVTLAEDWLEALDRERDRSGEIVLYRRDMAQYNREREGYRNRHKVKADPAPSEQDMRKAREGYPERRREAIEAALAHLFREHPEYRGRRVGQITCRLVFHLPADFPRGPDGVPRDVEVEAILDGGAA